jgi:hypothetical protein
MNNAFKKCLNKIEKNGNEKKKDIFWLLLLLVENGRIEKSHVSHNETTHSLKKGKREKGKKRRREEKRGEEE